MRSHSSVFGKLISHTRGSLSGGRCRCLCLHMPLRCSLRSVWIPPAPDANHCMEITVLQTYLIRAYLFTIMAWFGIQLFTVFFFPDCDQVLIAGMLYPFCLLLRVPEIMSCYTSIWQNCMISHFSPLISLHHLHIVHIDVSILQISFLNYSFLLVKLFIIYFQELLRFFTDLDVTQLHIMTTVHVLPINLPYCYQSLVMEAEKLRIEIHYLGLGSWMIEMSIQQAGYRNDCGMVFSTSV